MPNHCYNSLAITAPAEVIHEIRRLMEGDSDGVNSPFDSAQILPQPEDVGDGWYDWRLENWGTKWNAYEVQVSNEPEGLVFSFLTAWAPPTPVVAELAQRFPDARLEHYFEEGQEDVLGRIVYHLGDEVSREEPEWSSDEGRNLREEFGFGVDEDE